MPNTSKIALKNHCLQVLENQAKEMQNTLAEIQLALEEETKSSVGDKYETARAQLQAEQKRIDQQLLHIIAQHKALHDLNHDPHTVIDEGSTIELILGDKHLNIYIGVALGALVFVDTHWQIISEISPLAQAIKGKRAGDAFVFQGKNCQIITVG
ncbi:MAG: hypothetical protein ACK448_06110 [Bacteroidota bacterium]|jgi:transcription elongation GreA/GreB family factor